MTIDIIKKPINHEDRRGLIMDIFPKLAPECVTLITTLRGMVRGNHYHRETTQWMFVVSGKLWVYEQPLTQLGESEPVSRVLLVAGDLVGHHANVIHAYKAAEDTVSLAFAQGVRKGMDYEADTVRVDSIIDRWMIQRRGEPGAAIE